MQQPGKPITSTHNLTLLNSIFEYISDPNKEQAASNANKCHIKINMPEKKRKTTPEISLLPFALQLVCRFNTFSTPHHIFSCKSLRSEYAWITASKKRFCATNAIIANVWALKKGTKVQRGLACAHFFFAVCLLFLSGSFNTCCMFLPSVHRWRYYSEHPKGVLSLQGHL